MHFSVITGVNEEVSGDHRLAHVCTAAALAGQDLAAGLDRMVS